ncbi:Cation/H(+) antiporter 15 [Abeliophyllum distichum]|uniref:Cation/H(+) antiporter 15 n=1 Tax=Abeliophyllum distichum TaxID=126358 RepID=A0ABD1VWW7_9LAMI
MLIDFCLRPLGQSSMVTQIFGGILLGPSVLGHKGSIGRTIFPARGSTTVVTGATFGLMFFLFAMGVKADPMMMVRPGRQAAILGISAMFFTLVLTLSLAFLLTHYVPMDGTLAESLPFIAASQCLTPFPNISCLLTELKMSNSDLGRIAISASMLCDVIGMTLVVILLAILQANFDPLKSVVAIVAAFLFVVSLVYIIKPLLLRVLRGIPNGKALGEQYIIGTFTCVLAVGVISELIGQHFVLGPLVLGLMVPEGPPLGTALISKLDIPVGKIFYPIFLTTSGLKTDIFKIHLQSLWIVLSVVMFSCVVKIGAVILSSRYLHINFQDSFVIGLMLNARGVCELIVYNLWRDGLLLTDQEFSISVIALIGVTAIITPLIKFMYDPSKQRVPLKRRTIQHAKRDAELRILVCLQNQDSVPSIINILEASNATEESPIAVIAVLLEEVVGRANPLLVAHQSTRILQPSNSKSSHIINALRQYELCNERCVTVQSFSAISHAETMHEDICRVALDQNATIVILPFHKHWEIDGSIGLVNRSIQTMNIKVLEKAPCSVGILVDRGNLTGSLSILNTQSIYRVAVIYIGGPDDAESLYYGARMGRHNNVTLTLVRYLLFGSDNARERKQDNILIDDVRQAHNGNHNFIYQEQLVKDGVGLTASLRALENHFDLMIVGRNHQASQILMGLGAWSECPELGVVGDMLASTDIGSIASVLVVQQQILLGGKLKSRMMKPVIISQETGYDASVTGPLTTPVTNDDAKWEIAIDRDRD